VRLILASASPRRAELLAAAGVGFDIDPVGVDERRLDGESPAAYVERVARLKAAAGAARHRGRVVVGADTAVVVDDEVLGKPADEADARRMLQRLSGRRHEVMTGVAVARNGELATRVERTSVWFRELGDEEIDGYVASGEPLDKAGAYAIQGRAAGFVRQISGSYSNVVGLPLAALADLLEAAGAVDSGACGPYPEG
jgi:septum formation protein